MTDPTIAKVEILIQQKKFTQAEQILKDLLSQDSGNIHLLSLLAEVNLQQDKTENAERIIDNAIGTAPDSPYLFYVKSRIAVQKSDYDGAEKNIEQAIALDPLVGDYHAVLGTIKLARKQYEAALACANKALEVDAENILALNTRSSALLKLNKSEEAFITIEGALREDPDNAYTHANYGWNLLEKGEHKKALEHFKESLKQDPNFDYAQAGMVQALKANNPVYRMFLKYAFWIGNLTSKYQWGVIIGFYLGVRGLKVVAASSEVLRPYLTPLIIVLALVAFSTWVITPISNLFLRFNRYGQFLLSKTEKLSSNFVAMSFALFLIGLMCFFVTGKEQFLAVVAFGFAMMVPFSQMFAPSKYKHAFLIYAIIMVIVGISAIALTFSTGDLFNSMTPVFILGFVAFQWFANYLLIKEGNR